ncbi:MAG: CehA/McbA family metallohydrolase [Deltaproteobacteria bacterium]|nr:CehA/McbA family metallohydrolase [Deltaproteobacteria bacterium]
MGCRAQISYLSFRLAGPSTRIRVLMAALIAVAGVACSSRDDTRVIAKRITARSELIGGPGALGEVGDFILENEEIRVIIQNTGYSRGFGIYGGSLIDADLQRPITAGDSAGGRGRDNFAELFPALFLKALRPTSIEAVDNEDGSASVIVTGRPDHFVYLARLVTDVAVPGDGLLFRNEYRLEPKKRYVKITTTVINEGLSEVQLGSGLGALLGGDFTLPVGDVILFGAGNDVFAPKAGFDLRFTLQALYEQPPPLPKLPGLVTPFIATRGEGVSYGFLSGVTMEDEAYLTKMEYDGAHVDDLLVPFSASAFLGAFYGAAPAKLDARGTPSGRSSFSFTKYFIVGSGDVASVRDVEHEIRQHVTGTFSGQVLNRETHEPEANVDVITFDAEGSPYDQHTTDRDGRWRGRYEPGRYTVRVLADGRFPTSPVSFRVVADDEAYVEIDLDPPGQVAVRIVDADDGALLPAKCSLVATYSAPAAGFEPREFLYSLRMGESKRATDFVPDTSDPETRRFVEEVVLAPAGRKTEKVRPGRYRAVCSRGNEYNLFQDDIDVVAGQLSPIDAVLRRVVDTRGYASGDYHLHAEHSVDSSLAMADRIAHAAAEGLDIACATDHNYVTDYSKVIEALDLNAWIQGMVGLELTTIEVGHFNGFPLRYDPGPITKGAFEWSSRTPADLFSDLRGLGRYGPAKTIVQVNHPRDSILGYFHNFGLDADTGEPSENLTSLPPAAAVFSEDFDAIEVFNGKRLDNVRTYRVPESLPPGRKPSFPIAAAGEILRDEDGKVAYPGVMEDWFNLLNRGRIYTAMGNSDTHSLHDEPGVPRTYAPVTDDRPGAIDEREIVDAFQNQRAIVTNGPFLKLTAVGLGPCRARRSGGVLDHETCELGEVVTPDRGRVAFSLEVRKPDWMDVARVRFILGGDVVATSEAPDTLVFSETIRIERDGWLIAEVSGQQSMFPVVAPLEEPVFQMTDALAALVAPLGFGFNALGVLRPDQTRVVTPYAFTNPIFIDGDGDGQYDVASRALEAGVRDETRGLDARVPSTDPKDRAVPALVRMFSTFARHAD